jgi:polyhydroxyalkanoate synthesis regulator phasin
MAEESKKSAPGDVAGLLEAAFMMGIGVMEVTKDKVSGLTDELIERGKMSQSDAKKVASRISEMANEQQEMLRKTVREQTEGALDTAGLATHEEIAALRAEVAELKAMIAAMRDTGSTPVE